MVKEYSEGLGKSMKGGMGKIFLNSSNLEGFQEAQAL